mgnify:FL=1
MRRVVVFLGVGGVGKTTLIWRLIGLSLTPSRTVRPGVYRVFYDGKYYELVDVPGQFAAEVAAAAARTFNAYFDRALFVYDLTREDTLEALYLIKEQLCLFSKCLAARETWVVGNKRDLAEKYGVEHEPDLKALGANEFVKISALYDNAWELARLLP